MFRSNILRPRLNVVHSNLRWFLSDAFKCTTEWQSRLTSPYLKQIKTDNLYQEIEQSFQQLGKTTAIDIDIFFNNFQCSDDGNINEISDVLHKLRLTEETSSTLDSTSHAVIRHFVDMGHITELINILDNRLIYGIFLDSYVTSYTLDYLIKKNDFTSAAKIAAQWVQQEEELDNELTKSLAILACFRYFENPDVFYPAHQQLELQEKEVNMY